MTWIAIGLAALLLAAIALGAIANATIKLVEELAHDARTSSQRVRRLLALLTGPAPTPPESGAGVYDSIDDAGKAMASLSLSNYQAELPRFEATTNYMAAFATYQRLLRTHQLFRLRFRPTISELRRADTATANMRRLASEATYRCEVLEKERGKRDALLRRLSSARFDLVQFNPLPVQADATLNSLPKLIDAHRFAVNSLIDAEKRFDLPQPDILRSYAQELDALDRLSAELTVEQARRADDRARALAERQAVEQAEQERRRKAAAEAAEERRQAIARRHAEWAKLRERLREAVRSASIQRAAELTVRSNQDRLMTDIGGATRGDDDLGLPYSREQVTEYINLVAPDYSAAPQRRPTIEESTLPRFLKRKEGSLGEFVGRFDPERLPDSPLRTVAVGVLQGLREQAERYYAAVVSEDHHANLSHICPKLAVEVIFDPDDRVVGLSVELPDITEFEFVRITQLKNGRESVKPMADSARRKSYEFIQYALAVRLICACASADFTGTLTAVALNGFVTHVDPATGLPRRDMIMSLFVTDLPTVRSIALDRIDPKETFRAWRGIAGARIHELTPVRPILNLDRRDSRLRPDKDVMDAMENTTNLASMEWQDFEHLVRQLFQMEFSNAGAEVRVTQSSRDRGVDAIAFDPDPIRGGKFVIQAKRYNDVVDVSAVRDLFGVVMNEGANRGILVTTSRFGKDSYDFALDKPLTLISGPELLGMLEKHGFRFKIDLRSR